MKKHKVFVAIDTNKISVAKKIIKETRNSNISIFPKFGLQFFYAKKNRAFLEKLNTEFFLDVKISDTSTTALGAMDSLKDIKKIRWITAHANGGYNMLKAINKKAKQINKKISVLGVSILTSLDDRSVRELGHTKTVKQLVLKQAGIIKKSGCKGIIASAEEVKIIKKKYKNLFVVTPGIRFSDDNKNDQKRVFTPYEALIVKKADAIVMGRSLVSKNLKNNLKKLIQSLN
tara:strand:- start:241 stop:933 length:693 start_codon:yes stop_codon:yes gene_type:complete